MDGCERVRDQRSASASNKPGLLVRCRNNALDGAGCSEREGRAQVHRRGGNTNSRGNTTVHPNDVTPSNCQGSQTVNAIPDERAQQVYDRINRTWRFQGADDKRSMITELTRLGGSGLAGNIAKLIDEMQTELRLEELDSPGGERG